MVRCKRLVFNSFQVNSYVAYVDQGPCIIIDPACSNDLEREKLVKFISEQDLKPEFILATHGHFDHLPGVHFVKEKYDIPFYGHHEDLNLIQYARQQGEMFGFNFEVDPPEFEKFLKDEEIVNWGGGNFKALHVPGHSKGSLAYHFTESGFVLTGDVLFQGSIGRTDLPGGDFDTLITSIKTKLMVMDNEVVVCSGHGPETSIGVEKASNPFL